MPYDTGSALSAIKTPFCRLLISGLTLKARSLSPYGSLLAAKHWWAAGKKASRDA